LKSGKSQIECVWWSWSDLFCSKSFSELYFWDAKSFIDAIEQYFTSNEKANASSLLTKLISIKYKGKENIREYIMEMSNLTSKLKALKLELPDDLLVHLVLIYLSAHFGQLKVSYNTHKDKWTLDELISHYARGGKKAKWEDWNCSFSIKLP